MTQTQVVEIKLNEVKFFRCLKCNIRNITNTFKYCSNCGKKIIW